MSNDDIERAGGTGRNDIMRHEYRELSDLAKMQIRQVKDLGLAFVKLLHNIGGTDPDNPSNRQASRELLTAQTKIQEAVMWATNHITR